MKKRGKLVADKLVTLVAVLVSFLIIVGVMVIVIERGSVGWKDVLCAFSVRIASKTHMGVNFFPLACAPQKFGVKGNNIEAMSKISDLMKRCWWMFGESKIEDIKSNLGGDGIHICYTIDPLEIEEVISIGDFIEFLKNSNNVEEGKEEESVYNYIQQGESFYGLCFDRELENFEGKKVYYIKFRDDVTSIFGGNEDQIMISENSRFKGGKCKSLV